MKKRTRYTLLLVGFIFFLIAAPLIVFYATGISYDFQNGGPVKTGVLVANTEPADAKVYLDGKLAGTSPLKEKFISPGEHTILVEKDGYFPWKKRLEIKPGKVTWITSDIENIILLKQTPKENVIAQNVLDFAFTGNTIYYLSPGSIAVVKNEKYEDTQITSLPNDLNKILLSPDGSKALISGANKTIIFNINDSKVTDLSNQVSSTALNSFSNNNDLFSLENGVLSSINEETQTKTIITDGVLTFTNSENGTYLLKLDGDKYNLLFLPRLSDFSKAQILQTGLPNFKSAELLVTEKKEVYIKGDNVVYKVNEQLTKTAENVKTWQYHPENNTILFSTDSELSWYDSDSGATKLITRQSKLLFSPWLSNAIGYAFFGDEHNLIALELDSRDQQNQYHLTNISKLSKIWLDSDAKTLTIIDAGVLKNILIR